MSIHPQNSIDAKRNPSNRKSNTCGRKKRETVERALAGRRDHCTRHPYDAVAAAHKEKLEAQLASM